MGWEAGAGRIATPGGQWAGGAQGAPPRSPGQAKVSPQGPPLWCLAPGPRWWAWWCQDSNSSEVPGPCLTGKGQAEGGGGSLCLGWTFGIYFPQDSNW